MKKYRKHNSLCYWLLGCSFRVSFRWLCVILLAQVRKKSLRTLLNAAVPLHFIPGSCCPPLPFDAERLHVFDQAVDQLSAFQPMVLRTSLAAHVHKYVISAHREMQVFTYLYLSVYCGLPSIGEPVLRCFCAHDRYDVVCLFVNDEADGEILKSLGVFGVGMVALR